MQTLISLSTADLKDFLLWCLAINYLILLIWFGVFSLAHTWIYTLHSRWFHLSRETFDGMHYAGMAFYKIGVLIFNVAPLIALYIMH